LGSDIQKVILPGAQTCLHPWCASYYVSIPAPHLMRDGNDHLSTSRNNANYLMPLLVNVNL
jgi:hypothetical protein